jgi:acyl-[acyl-carrier-protein] desaturase
LVETRISDGLGLERAVSSGMRVSFDIHFQLTSFRSKARPRNCYQVLRLGADTARTISPARLTSGATYQLKDALLFPRDPRGTYNRRAPSVQRAPVRSGLKEPSLEPSYQVSFDSCGIPVLHSKGQDMGTLVVDPAKDHALIEELAGPAASLFERHLAASKQWYPFEDVPWDNAADFAEEAWNAQQYPLSTGVQSAIIVNVLTEDNLPYYTHTLMSPIKADHPLRQWSLRWTAEEWRHSAAIRDWILATRAIDPYRLEDDRMVQMSKGEVPQSASVAEMISYVSFQELATQVAHRNTGMALDKTKRGKKIMSKVAGDEGLHHAFYRDLVLAGLEIDPSTMVMAIQSELRNFKMPGTGIPGFEQHEVEIALAGIFGAQQFLEAVVKPTVAYWHLFELEGLRPEAERAREKIAKNIAGLTRLAAAQQTRIDALRAEATP